MSHPYNERHARSLPSKVVVGTLLVRYSINSWWPGHGDPGIALVLGEVTVSERNSQCSNTPGEAQKQYWRVGVQWEPPAKTQSSLGVARSEVGALKSGEELRTRETSGEREMQR